MEQERKNQDQMEQQTIQEWSMWSPEEARTSDSAAVLWDRIDILDGAVTYHIYVNGIDRAVTQHTDYTITDLESSCSYYIGLEAWVNGTCKYLFPGINICTKSQPADLCITDFGAEADAGRIQTAEIQAAIDACPLGGRVRIPAGVFHTGAIYLQSNMTLFLEEGSRLVGSEELSDYPLMQYRFEGLETACYASLINTKEPEPDAIERNRTVTDSAESDKEEAQAKDSLHDITIAGSGTIDASGSVLRRKELEAGEGKPGRAICIRNAKRVYLTGITVRQSPAWCVHLIYCSQISVNQVQINTKYDEQGHLYENITNGDGLDPDSCSRVHIFHSVIASEDDCIAVKSGRDQEGRQVGIPSEHIRITNCDFLSGFGVAMGSEMSGDIRDVLVQDCRFTNTFSAASLKAPRGRGGVLENIRYDHITHDNQSTEYEDCEWFRGALYIDQFYSHITYDPVESQPANEGTSKIRSLIFENITLDTVGGNAIYLCGLPEQPLQDIRMSRIRAKGKYGMKAANVRGLTMEEVTVECQEGEPYEIRCVRDLIQKA